jgi:hypothetical protein
VASPRARYRPHATGGAAALGVAIVPLAIVALIVWARFA